MATTSFRQERPRCGTVAIQCRDCEEIDSAEVGEYRCVCEATYQVVPQHYQSYDVETVLELTRGAD